MVNGAEQRGSRQIDRRTFLRETAKWATRAALGLTLASCAGEDSTRQTPAPNPGAEKPSFQSGMTLTVWERGALESPQGIRAVQNIAATGANSIALIPTWYQRGKDATDIYEDPAKTSSDRGLRDTIHRAHDLGMTVFLKPHIDTPDNAWRGYFGENFDDADRTKWFASYHTFIDRYAQLADETGVELFSVGCELKSLSQVDKQWDAVTRAVKDVYRGKVTYSSHFEEPIRWYGDLDAIGVNEYNPMTTNIHPSSDEIAAYWANRVATYKEWQQVTGKPFILTEVGCSSSEGSLTAPHDFVSQTPDEDIQALGYQAALDALAKPDTQQVVKGAYWWNWYTYDFPDPREDIGLSPQGKKAQEVFTAFNKNLK